MAKYKMPTVKQFLKKKRKIRYYDRPDIKTLFDSLKTCLKIYWRKRNLIWVVLEQEMRAQAEKNIKPYNKKVGDWLKFLKDLRYYFFCEGKRKHRRLNREVGPLWYNELSSDQKEILNNLKSNIHQDLLEDLPVRTRKALRDLGITLKLPNDILMKTMVSSFEDPGVFMWYLYTAIYKKQPCEASSSYDTNARILMSSLVFIDLEECTDRLDSLVKRAPPPPPQPKKKQPTVIIPNIRFGEYLQRVTVPCYTSCRSDKKKKKPKLAYKIKLRSDESYERLTRDTSFLDKRIERNKKEKQLERVCHYKFWEPPSTLRNTDPKMAAYVMKLKMFKKKAKPKYTKYSPNENMQFHIGTVSYTGGQPRFMLNNVAYLPTGYMALNGGFVLYRGEYVTLILGMWKYPRCTELKCFSTCNCLTQWEGKVMDYLHESRCKCGHNYDYGNEGKATEKYFYPPTKHAPHFFDQAKIYNFEPMEDFIRDTFREALKSTDTTPEPSLPTISPYGLKEKELLGAILADVADSPLLIPHLPKANLLNNLQEWIRKRVKGSIVKKQHKQWMLQSQRRWLDLKHMDFRARAFLIPFTQKQLEHITWAHRHVVQKLCLNLLDSFVTRNRQKQLEQTRLMWSTMKYDAYPSKSFLDTFFTYMPGRMQDTFLINPYTSNNTSRRQGKTCPLEKMV